MMGHSLHHLLAFFIFSTFVLSIRTEEDCGELKQANTSAASGQYTVRLLNGTSCEGVNGVLTNGICCVQVYCDMQTFGGGWTVFHKRFNGSVDFNRNWTEYEMGFGDLGGEFWAGNRLLYHFSARKTYEMLVELHQTERNCSVYAEYASFRLNNSVDYKLLLGSYTGGTAGHGLQKHNDMRFTTMDQDNDKADGNCAELWHGGWWFKACLMTFLNGPYFDGCLVNKNKGMIWKTARGQYYGFGKAEMKLRPADYSLKSGIPDQKFSCEDGTFVPCPKDCHWSEWGSWTECMSGLQSRSRTAEKLYSAGMDCQGENSETQPCHGQNRLGVHMYQQHRGSKVSSQDVFEELVNVRRDRCALECFRRGSACDGFHYSPQNSTCQLYHSDAGFTIQNSNNFDRYE